VAYDYAVSGMLADGTPVEFGGWETQVQRRMENGWRIAHVHYSVRADVPAGP
jgi:hypothetical protein